MQAVCRMLEGASCELGLNKYLRMQTSSITLISLVFVRRWRTLECAS